MIIILLFSLNLHEAIPLQSSFSPVIVMADYNKEYKHVINSDVVYMFLYNVTNISLMETVRINVESNASNDEPLIVFVHGNKETLSWQIPLVVKSRHFDNLILGENRSIEISPSQPVYYGYTFSEEIESFVIVHVKSSSDICMILSIQNMSCPAFDLDDSIEFSGFWQTVNRQGGILVPREKYPLGFFVVLTVKTDDTDCYGVPFMNPLRVKHVILTIKASITKRDYIIASGLVVLVIFSFCVIYAVSIVVSKIKEGREIKQLLYDQSEHIDAPIPSSSTVEEIAPQQSISIDEDSSLDEDDIDVMEDAFSDKEVIRTKRVLSVCDLARKDPKILRHKSRLYFYYLITITIFYTLPAIQLVFTYQYILDITGDGDNCYYNFLCAHPIGALSDVNHVFSNIGYIVLGLLFLFLTYCREHNEFEREKNKCYGIPQHYGLFYAMGTALVMEGILSGCYHICPNRSNFQFDLSNSSPGYKCSSISYIWNFGIDYLHRIDRRAEYFNILLDYFYDHISFNLSIYDHSNLLYGTMEM
ncbi:SID1 transmembrane family member 1 [Eufriesea mexicana]|nr:SID1 transmembrane family member 1 [Eufriesea mexicana]